jgi:hypothetical protein
VHVHIATSEVFTSVKVYIVVTDVYEGPNTSFLRIIVPPNKFVHAVTHLNYIRRRLVRVLVGTYFILNKVLRDFYQSPQGDSGAVA